MLCVNCELPTEPQEHFTLWTSHKIGALLQDPAYRRLVKDPAETVERKTSLLLTRSTLAQVCRRLRHAGTRPPRLYRFPKIHKEGVPTYKLSSLCAASRKVACSFPDGVVGIFHWHNPSVHTIALGSTQSFNRNEYQEYFLGDKSGRCQGLTTLPPSCADCLEIWEPQPPGNLRACPGLHV